MSAISKRLERDLDWRRTELASLKLAIGSAASGSDRERALLRAVFAMLYAHYEGFIKVALESYADEITSARVRAGRLRNNLQPAALRDALLAFSKVDRVSFLVDLRTSYRSPARIKVDFGEGNFWPDKVTKLLDSLDIHSKYLATESLRLSTLVKRRNDIAHGDSNVVKSLSEYQDYEDSAMFVMYEIAIEIDNKLNSKHYLK